MKNIISSILIGAMMLSLVGCSSDSTSTAVGSSTSEETEEVEEVGEVTVIGQVLSVAGNVVTIQVGSYAEQAGGMGNMQGGRTEGEMPEGMTEGEMPEGMTEGEMPEGMTEGEMPEGMTEGEMPEGMTEGEMSEGMTEREMPEGMTEGEMPEGMTEGEMPGMEEAGIVAADMSDVIELSDETVEIMIPVGTPVYSSSGVTYDFTDIVDECYLTITEDANGTIIAVNVLG
ncbi:MAG: hypothetical protein R3Y58_04350 [Eubacteriales bacterium]